MVTERAIDMTSPGETWGVDMVMAVCENCDHRFLIAAGDEQVICPACYARPLVRLPEQASPAQPELFLPYKLQAAALRQAVERFAAGLWFPPEDLNPANLEKRLRKVFLPVWLVDSSVQATWQAEAGYHYQVVSHQEHYDDMRSGWSERQVNETRVRWEPRVGRLQRAYQNIAAPALENEHALFSRVGSFNYAQAQPYTFAQALGGSQPAGWAVGLPEREQTDAWQDALPVLQSAAAEECRAACGADKIREFQWTPAFQGQNWTLLLLPIFTTYYLDDERKAQMVTIHGQTGRLAGLRRASMQSAQKAAIWLAVGALICFVLSLAGSAASILVPVLLPLVAFGWLAATALGVGIFFPFAVVWWVNRSPSQYSG